MSTSLISKRPRPKTMIGPYMYASSPLADEMHLAQKSYMTTRWTTIFSSKSTYPDAINFKRVEEVPLQGYLAHEKTPTPIGSP